MRFPTRYTAALRDKSFSPNLSGPSLTKQAFKDECDINSIMRRYLSTGVVPGNVKVGRYGDFTGANDFLEAQMVLRNANEQFMTLPSAVRARFNNSPFEMLEFVGDRANIDEARKLGLLKAEEPKAPPAVPPDATK